MKDYKKHLFEMVKADIDTGKIKNFREKRKKDLKAANQVQNTTKAQPKKSKKQKRK